jgi:hypothetical protein
MCPNTGRWFAMAALLAVSLAPACVLDVGQKHECRSKSDCLGERSCVDGTCRALTRDAASSAGDAAPDAPGGDGDATSSDGSSNDESDDRSHADASASDGPTDTTDSSHDTMGSPSDALDGDASGDARADASGDARADASDAAPLPRYTATGTPNYVFVTSATIALDFGSLDAADKICADTAKAAKLPGTYVAWLSTSTINARQRLGTARGWIRPDGAPFADTIADIISNRIFYPPVIDENGRELRGSYKKEPVVTGTLANGTVGGTCMDWTTAVNSQNFFPTVGVTTDTPIGWTAFDDRDYPVGCDIGAHLYCFGVDHTTPVQVVPQPGKKAFVSDGSFTMLGLDGADRLCAAEATRAHLTGTFMALLATTGATAASRFPSPDHRWVRVDGVPLVEPGQDLFRDGPRTALLSVTSSGAPTDAWIMTGAGSPLTLSPDLLSSCRNWVDTGQEETLAITGLANQFDDWFDHIANPDRCTRGGDNRVYCLEK